MADAVRVVMADDDELVAQMLSLACRNRGLEVVGHASSYDDLAQLCAEVRADVAVVADHLGDVPVETCLAALASSSTPVIVLSDDPSPERLSSLLADNVAGYFSYDVAPDEVAAGIVAVARGHVALNPAVASTIVRQWRRMRAQPVNLSSRRRSALTPREHEILCAMAEGLAAKAIAVRLGVALKTVENHKIRVFDKMGVRTQAQAVSVAFSMGVASAPASGDDCPSRVPHAD